MKLNSRVEVTSTVVLAVLACALTAFLIWASPRGYDLWDEGYYLIMSRYPQDVGATLTAYYYYNGVLLSLSGHDIATFRCVGLVCLFAATLVLCIGLRAIDRVLSIQAFSSVDFVQLLSMLFIGTLVYYGAFALATPGYNLLTTMCLTAAAGTTLLALAASSSGYRSRSVGWMLVTGLLIGLEFFVKAPSAALMFAAVVVSAAFWPNLRTAVRYRLLGACALGAGAWLSMHFAVFETPSAFLGKLRLSTEYSAHLGVALGVRDIGRYAMDLVRVAWGMRKSWLATLVLVLLVLAYKMLPRPNERLITALCWIAILGVALAHIGANYHLGGHAQTQNSRQLMGFYLFWALALLAISVVLDVWNRPDGRQTIWMRRQDLLLMGMLAAIPFIGAIGTSNFIGYNWVLTLGPWFALLIYLAARVEAQGLPLRVPAQLAIAAFAAAQLFTGYWTALYGSAKGVQDQRHLTVIGNPPSRLLLDKGAHDAIEALKAAADRCGLRIGDRILGFYQAPGLVYALGGRILVFPGFTARFRDLLTAPTAAEAMLASFPYREAHDAFVITYLVSPEIPAPDLQKIGRKLPEDYKLCGEALWPSSRSVIKLWKPIGP